MSVILGLFLSVGSPSVGVVSPSPLARPLLKLVPQRVVRVGRGPAVRTSAQRLAALTGRYGPEVRQAMDKVGPAALEVLEQGGPQVAAKLRLLARKGTLALRLVQTPQRWNLVSRSGAAGTEAWLRHGTLVEPLLRTWGRPAAQALNRLSPRSARRLALILGEPAFQSTTHTPRLLQVLAERGEAALQFVWQHKGTLAVSAVLVAFLNDPDPFLTGAADLTALAAQHAVAPLTEVPREMVGTLARSVQGKVLLGAGLSLVLIGSWLRSRRRIAPVTSV